VDLASQFKGGNRKKYADENKLDGITGLNGEGIGRIDCPGSALKSRRNLIMDCVHSYSTKAQNQLNQKSLHAVRSEREKEEGLSI